MSDLVTLRRGLFLVSLPIFFINFSVPIQAKQLGATAIEIGVLFSLFTLSILALRPLVGYGLDKIGRKPFLVAAMAFYTLAHFSYAAADAIEWMYLARFTQGIGAALLLITIDTITTDLTDSSVRPAEMGRNMEVQTRSSIVGATVGFTLVGAVPLLAWQYSFSFFAVCSLLAFVYLALRFESTKPVEYESGAFTVTPGLRKLIGIVFVAGFANALIQPIYLIYLQDRFELSVQQLTWAFLPAAGVFAFLPSRTGGLNERFGSHNVLALGFLLSGFVYLVLPMLSKIGLFVVLYTVSAVGWALVEPARKALTALLGEDGAVGRRFGMTELYAGIGATIGPVIGGYLYDYQSPAAAFIANGMLLLLSALAAKLLLTPKTV